MLRSALQEIQRLRSIVEGESANQFQTPPSKATQLSPLARATQEKAATVPKVIARTDMYEEVDSTQDCWSAWRCVSGAFVWLFSRLTSARSCPTGLSRCDYDACAKLRRAQLVATSTTRRTSSGSEGGPGAKSSKWL